MLRTNSILWLGLAALTCCSSSDNQLPDRVWLEGGCFQMGEVRIYPEEGPLIEACVDDFLIMSHEVTFGQYSRFAEETGYLTRAERGWSRAEDGGPGVDVAPASAVFIPPRDMRPANLNWWKLVDGASWRKPFGPNSDTLPSPDEPVVHITKADAEAYAEWAGGRLPTEAEWEYAARGGLNGALLAWPEAEQSALKDKANTWNGIFPVANSAEDGFEGVAPVGSYPPNGFGLYDMIGNVWEWTSTPYAPNHSSVSRERAGVEGYDPSQPGIAVGTIRGGSFLCAQNYCYRFRPAARQAQDLAFGASHIGFRVVWDDKISKSDEP